MSKRNIRGDVEAIRAQYAASPWKAEVQPWKDGAGCNVWPIVNLWGPEQEPGFASAVICSRCVEPFLAELCWPRDAYWRVSTRFGVLWACDRKDLVSIRGYIESVDRPSGRHAHYKIPGAMITSKARPEMLRAIDRALEEEDRG